MGDRVAVMSAGRLQQYDAPQTLYDTPANLFVAAFIGSPAMNLYRARVDEEGTYLSLGSQRLELPERLRAERAMGRYRGSDVVVGIRPEDLSDAAMAGDDGAGRRLEGAVELIEALGAEKLVHFRIDAEKAVTEEQAGTEEEAPAGNLTSELTAGTAAGSVARVPPASRIEADETARFVVDTEHLHLFDPESGEAIASPEPR